ncbi:MAG: hypothetical protein ACYC4E_00865 [Carboxydocellales bacterium]
MEAIRGKWITVDKRAKIPENVAKAVLMLSGHKVTLVLDGENVKIVAVEEDAKGVATGKLSLDNISLLGDEVI